MTGSPRILIVKLSAIGDVVHTLPALNALRAHYPQAHITWLVEETAADLVLGHHALDRILVSRRKSWFKGLRGPGRYANFKEMAGFLKRLRADTYDMVFDFQAALKGAVLIALVHSRRKIGFGRGLEHQEGSYRVLNERIPAVSMEIHALKRGLLLLEAIGIPTDSIEYGIPVQEKHRAWVDTALGAEGITPNQPYLVINPMAKWPTKLWIEDRFAQLADQIIGRYDLPIIFTGSGEDRPAIDTIISRMHNRATNMAGETDLITLAALLDRAQAMVTTDTGPMHIAAAVQTPVVALLGPTAPWRTGPFGDLHQVVTSNAKCAPCFKRNCLSMECMNEIQIEQVIWELEKILDLK